MMDHVPYLLGAAAGTKQVSIRAGDVHTAMTLKDRMPAVASAWTDSQKSFKIPPNSASL
jgi:hypothetical protein